MTTHKTTINIVRGSVLDQDVDAIVNAANTSMRGGSGVDGAIHRAAGKGLMEELVKAAPHGARTGTAIITGGHNLKQRYVIHTAGPYWNGGKRGEVEKLTSCYRACLEKAEEKKLRSIAFCSISTGIYGYPLEQAAPLALQTVKEYLKSHPETTLERVVFAMFGQSEYEAFSSAWESMTE